MLGLIWYLLVRSLKKMIIMYLKNETSKSQSISQFTHVDVITLRVMLKCIINYNGTNVFIINRNNRNALFIGKFRNFDPTFHDVRLNQYIYIFFSMPGDISRFPKVHLNFFLMWQIFWTQPYSQKYNFSQESKT